MNRILVMELKVEQEDAKTLKCLWNSVHQATWEQMHMAEMHLEEDKAQLKAKDHGSKTAKLLTCLILVN